MAGVAMSRRADRRRRVVVAGTVTTSAGLAVMIPVSQQAGTALLLAVLRLTETCQLLLRRPAPLSRMRDGNSINRNIVALSCWTICIRVYSRTGFFCLAGKKFVQLP